jgi:hypothetical protein
MFAKTTNWKNARAVIEIIDGRAMPPARYFDEAQGTATTHERG